MAHLACNPQNLVWLDCEMTGLADDDRILEIAVVVTSPDLSVRIQGPAIAIHQNDRVLDAMDHWNRDTHGKSGLTKRSRTSNMDERRAEEKILSFLKAYVPAGRSPLCGNCVGHDRRFLEKYMPRLHNFFFREDMDVHTLIEMASRWNPRVVQGFVRKHAHGAAADINEVIDMMIYYRRTFLR